MPTAHRIACLRDDVVFLVYLYQRWLYPVDPKRVNGERPPPCGRQRCAEASPRQSTAFRWSRPSRRSLRLLPLPPLRRRRRLWSKPLLKPRRRRPPPRTTAQAPQARRSQTPAIPWRVDPQMRRVFDAGSSDEHASSWVKDFNVRIDDCNAWRPRRTSTFMDSCLLT